MNDQYFGLFSETIDFSCHQIDLSELIRNQQVVGSNPTGGSRKSSKIR